MADGNGDVRLLRSGYGPELADCSKCELRGSCKLKAVQGERPDDWQPGGLMLLGEGPGALETSMNRPFVGASGRLLDALLEHAGIARGDCWVTNATLGQPPRMTDKEAKGKKQGLHDRFPLALYSCLPRLEAEIAQAKPRVIVTLGLPAFMALAGFEEHKTRLVANPCDSIACEPTTRKLRTLCLVCANGACDWFEALPAQDPDAAATALKAQLAGHCPKCTQSIARLRPRAMACPRCGGKKKRQEAYTTFGAKYTLVGREGVAGAVFRTEELPSRLDELGVRFVVPTYHPSFCLRSAKVATGKYIAGQFAARVMTDHLRKAQELLDREPVYSASVTVARTAAEVHAWFAKHRGKRKAADIETNSMDGPWAVTAITCIGFAVADDPEALVVDTRHVRGFDAAGNPVDDALLDAMASHLEDPAERFVFFHGNYDRLVMRRVWGLEVRMDADVMYAHNALYPDEEHGLGFVAHELLDAPHWKADSHKIPTGQYDELSGYKSFDDLALYNARDNRSTILADEILRGPPGGRGRMHVERVTGAYDIDMQMADVALRMEMVGMPVDLGRLGEIEARSLRVMDEAQTEMRKLVGMPDLTPTSSKLIDVLFDPMGPLRLPVTAVTDTGQPSTAKEVLARFSDNPFVRELLRWRKYSYALSHYIRGEGLAPLPHDRRIHPQWKVTGTVTGRWSSSPNFQNWPKGDGKDPLTNLRSAIVAPPGRRFVGADYDQLELRIMANLSGDPALIARCMHADENDKLNPDKDPHSYVALMTFGQAFLQADKNQRKLLRDVAKRVVYGLNYGAGAETILAAIYDGGYDGPPLTKTIIENVIRAFFKAFPGVPDWRQQQVKLAMETNEVRSPICGRRREFPLGEIDVTVAYNYPIQAGAADVMNTRLLALLKALPSVDPTAELIAQVHDAVYFECDERRVDAVKAAVNEYLPTRLSFVEGAPEMAFTAAANDAESWDKAA